MSFEKKIVWLASYPKSGNTWFRAFLSALMDDGKIDINKLTTDGIFSSRQLISDYSDINSTILTDSEVKILQPEIFNLIASQTLKNRLFIKVHDAYTFNKSNLPIIPSESTHCAIYIIRNPLDIVASLANHNNTTIDETIKFMNNPEACFAFQKNNFNINIQTRQILYDWSSHVISWKTKPDFPVYFVRYEDLKKDSFTTFRDALRKIGDYYSDESIESAVLASNFNQLKQQEEDSGFKEKSYTSPIFFRNGQSENWSSELNKIQIGKITTFHKKMMKTFDYLHNKL
jgi:hypothetical protein